MSLIVSFDTINAMYKPPFQLTTKILELVAEIHELLGELKSASLYKPSVKLRKENQIRTVHHSLAIEGNTLSREQVTALLENKRVIGSPREILEVQNAIALYDKLEGLNPLLVKNLLSAHRLLMKDLLPKPGQYRRGGVGIFKGTKVSHVAPPAKLVPRLMEDLFDFLKNEKETSWLLKACIFHYELEFIHPFEDGNGRMGRLWQQLILMRQAPLFQFISVESLIHQKQKQYYRVLEKCDHRADSTLFIEFALGLILESLKGFAVDYRPVKISSLDRLKAALEYFGTKSFSRKDYQLFHKDIASATASRDLLEASEQGLVTKLGEKALTKYRKA